MLVSDSEEIGNVTISAEMVDRLLVRMGSEKNISNLCYGVSPEDSLLGAEQRGRAKSKWC